MASLQAYGRCWGAPAAPSGLVGVDVLARNKWSRLVLLAHPQSLRRPPLEPPALRMGEAGKVARAWGAPAAKDGLAWGNVLPRII